MSESIVSVEHVFKSVTDSTGTLDILRDIDFVLNARETAAIVGASGSGKSTLLSIIAGLDTPTSGTVRLAGQDMFAISEDERAALRARKIGFVFQSFQLMGNLSALENVMLPLELADQKDARASATEMLRRVGLGERLEQFLAPGHQRVQGLRIAGPHPTQESVIRAINQLTAYTGGGLTQPVNWTISHTEVTPPSCETTVRTDVSPGAAPHFKVVFNSGTNLWVCFPIGGKVDLSRPVPPPVGTPGT